MHDNWTLHWLTASGDFSGCRDVVEAEVTAAYEAAVRIVEPPRIDIVVQLSPFVIDELGVVGFALSDTAMTVSLDPNNPNFAEKARPAVSRTILHELHHNMRMKAHGRTTWTLGRSIVLEGLADRFVEECAGGPPDPWSVAVTGEPLSALAARARPLLEDTGYNHRAWFFGSKERPDPLPRWGGYSLGWALIGAYLEIEPEAKPSTILATPAEEIIETAWNRAFGTKA